MFGGVTKDREGKMQRLGMDSVMQVQLTTDLTCTVATVSMGPSPNFALAASLLLDNNTLLLYGGYVDSPESHPDHGHNMFQVNMNRQTYRTMTDPTEMACAGPSLVKATKAQLSLLGRRLKQ